SGLRYALDESNRTVVKAGYGSFVGRMPLTIPAFADYPIRTDRWLDGETGDVVREIVLRPTVGHLRFPRAAAVVLGLERELGRGLDAQLLFTRRRSTRLSTLRVPNESGDLMLDSTGMGNYQEIQLSLRRAWQDEQQVFVSYVESSADGELNEFA